MAFFVSIVKMVPVQPENLEFILEFDDSFFCASRHAFSTKRVGSSPPMRLLLWLPMDFSIESLIKCEQV